MKTIKLSSEMLSMSQAKFVDNLVNRGYTVNEICANMVLFVKKKEGANDNWSKPSRVKSHIKYRLDHQPKTYILSELHESIKGLFENSKLYETVLKRQTATATKVEKVTPTKVEKVVTPDENK